MSTDIYRSNQAESHKNISYQYIQHTYHLYRQEIDNTHQETLSTKVHGVSQKTLFVFFIIHLNDDQFTQNLYQFTS